MNDSVELRRLARGMRRTWWLLALLGLVGGLVGWGMSARVTPMYEATTTILVGDGIRAPDVDEEEIKASQGVAGTFTDLVRREPVMHGVVEDLGLDVSWHQLRERVRADLATSNPQLIVVSVRATSPGEGEAVAERIASRLVALSPTGTENTLRTFVEEQMDTLQAKIEENQQRIASMQSDLDSASAEESQRIQLRIDVLERLVSGWQDTYSGLIDRVPQQGTPTSLEVIDSAYAPPTPVSPRTQMNVLVAATLGLMLAGGLAYLREVARDRREADRAAALGHQSYAARLWQAGYDPTVHGQGRAGRPEADAVHANGTGDHHEPGPTRSRNRT